MISLGKVGESIMVCLPWSELGMLSCWTIRRIWGSKPMSSIRSASSRHRNLNTSFSQSTLSEHEKELEKDLLAVLEADLAPLHEVHEPARSGH